MARTVLIVDDVSFVRKTLAKIFVDANYQIIGEAENGIQAIKIYREHKPDLVTMDVVMPEMGGIEATKKIILMDKGAKIIMISAMDQEGLVMEAIHVGARDYIVKPFTKEDILKTAERVFIGEEQFVGGAMKRIELR